MRSLGGELIPIWLFVHMHPITWTRTPRGERGGDFPRRCSLFSWITYSSSLAWMKTDKNAGYRTLSLTNSQSNISVSCQWLKNWIVKGLAWEMTFSKTSQLNTTGHGNWSPPLSKGSHNRRCAYMQIGCFVARIVFCDTITIMGTSFYSERDTNNNICNKYVLIASRNRPMSLYILCVCVCLCGTTWILCRENVFKALLLNCSPFWNCFES